jgi:hypothetical protein
MTLYEKIKSIYSTLTEDDFLPFNGTILLQDDSNGKGTYIAKWEHPTLTRPTQAQLDEVTE